MNGFLLRDYQQAAVQKLKSGWLGEAGKLYRKQLLVLATGLGKTICFAHLIEWVLAGGGRALVLAHREELLDQAEDKIRKVVGDDYLIGREQGPNYAALMDQIVIASVPTLGRGGTESSRIARFPKDHFGLIIFDEAHHCTASTYQNIIEYFCDENSKTFMLGVTATPKRSDRESLYKIFDRVAYKMDIIEGIKSGNLSPVASHRISSKTDLSSVRVTVAGDYDINDLAKTVNNKERNSLIVRTYLELYGARDEKYQAIVFATNVEHAQALSEEFILSGISSEVISGETPKDQRRNAIEGFKKGEITILTNYGVLTEGFDHENLKVIISARPTKSELLLTQIIGRGTRLSQGKTRCEVVEIVDLHSDDTATCSKIFGFRRTFDAEGHNFLECIREADQMAEEKNWFDPYSAFSWTDMFDRFKKSIEKPSAPVGVSQFVSRYRYYPFGDGISRNQVTVDGLKYLLRISENALGNFDTELYLRKDETSWEVLFGEQAPDWTKAASVLESHIQHHYPSIDKLLNLNAPWRRRVFSEPATDRQWELIQKLRLTTLPRASVSKGEAMEMLNHFFNSGRSPNA